MIPVESARARVLAQCLPLHPRAIPIAEALGCVTSVALHSEEAVPPFANTAMDGFAVRAHDVPQGRLRVIGTIAAGGPPSLTVEAGQAVRIMTGAPIPPGADAVVPIERTVPSDDPDEVVFEDGCTASVGDHVRPAGEDVSPGQEVFPPFTVLTAGHLGVLSTLGMVRVPVFPRAKVGVLSTGDELVEGAQPLQPGQIRDSNRRTLLALASQAGCEPVDLGIARDDEVAITEALGRGLAECDAILTSGGVSVGDFDLVKKVLDDLSGGTMQWMQVAVKPAKPFAFGVVDGKPVFGLPGNPVSSMVSFELFARPGLRQLMGHPHLLRPRVAAIADEPLRRHPDGKLHLVRVVAEFADDGRVHVRSSGKQASNLLRSMALANSLALVPDGDGVEEGGSVDVWLLTYP